ncbi:MAG: tetratricopeptide repeat protein [Lachnospiraceae bacterium]|nr:tetratricopeptide repeat protein [Lachnospiraceae bacterium]MCH4063769.1 tetratricopeptide repeat protein [Lachnospiraceae bacterium]MCH4103508.1 tetratricopeptide repeat protein [Lachnospiraceae bacterium]MCI1309861.1 tetratricopeptide repeat protein [Lachnospiraceae bacterium]MCI1334312.1 tetratricopeptide repeat protein [Lachnospiraceae bacterium]
MDKAEYKSKIEEITAYAEKGQFHEAASTADEVDWKRVRSARTLCMIGEVYEMDHRFEDSLRVLEYALKRAPSGKAVLYRLAEICIRLKRLDDAKKYLREFENVSPNDTSKYILQYKLLRASGAPIQQQIDVLKEYKDREYTERWAYELARLYRKNGQNEKCVEECDDMILWFSEGKYVLKALELKMSITPLTPSQRAKYDAMTEYGKRPARRSSVKRTPAAGAGTGSAAGSSSASGSTAGTGFAAGSTSAGAGNGAGAGSAMGSNSASGFTAGSTTGAGTGNGAGAGSAMGSNSASGFTAGSMTGAGTGNGVGAGSAAGNSSAAGFTAGSTTGTGFAAGSQNGAAAGSASGFAGVGNGTGAGSAAGTSPATGIGSSTGFTAGNKTGNGAEAGPAAGAMAGSDSAAGTETSSSSDKSDAKSSEKKPSLLTRFVDSLKIPADSIPATGTLPDLSDVPIKEEKDVIEAAAEQNTTRREAEKELNAESREAENPAPAIPTDEIKEAEPEKPAQSEADKAIDSAVKNDEPPKEVDLDALFKETSSEFAGEIAGGGYRKMADPMLGDGETGAAKPAAPKDNTAETDPKQALLGRETDESLGLTRELNFKEVDKALREARAKNGGNVSSEPPASPELAARKTAFEANGKEFDPKAFEKQDVSDEDLKAALTIDDATKNELLADEPDGGEIPQEDSSEALMDMSALSMGGREESRSIIENIMEEPEVYTRLPLEGRKLTDAEKKAFSYFATVPGVDYQVTTALADIHNNAGDKTSKSGNICIIGRKGSGKTRLADGLIKAACMNLDMKACKVAHIKADAMNTKDPAVVCQKLSGGFLLIEEAGSLDDETIAKLNRAMEFRTDDLIVIIEDEKKPMRAMLAEHPEFAKKFSTRITVPVFMNDELVTFAKTYAKEQGYKLDEMATLALYTTIGNNQRDDEPVVIGKVKTMVDRAIEHSKRKLFGKTQDSADGRIMLREKDFNF